MQVADGGDGRTGEGGDGRTGEGAPLVINSDVAGGGGCSALSRGVWGLSTVGGPEAGRLQRKPAT